MKKEMKLACIALLFTYFITQNILLGQDKVRNHTSVNMKEKESIPVNNTIKGKYHIKIYYNYSLASDKSVTESIFIIK
jgi:hypothetical protein